MIISNNQISRILKTYGEQVKTNQVERSKGVAKTGKLDELVLSKQGKAIQLATQAIRETPDIRPEQVKELKDAVEKGTYSVSNEEVAEKLLGRRLIDELI